MVFDFETSWAGDYAPGWENTDYRHGTPPVGKMMQQVTTAHGGSYGMKLIADSVVPPATLGWDMFWAAVNPTNVNEYAMRKEFNPYIKVWYYDEGTNPVFTADTKSYYQVGQLASVPSWVNPYINGSEDWTDTQLGARTAGRVNYYHVAAGQNHPGWQDTGVARVADWHELKMQLSSADGTIHYFIDGTEVGTSYRSDYVDLISPYLMTQFTTPHGNWESLGYAKPYAIFDDFEMGSDYVPEPLTIAGVLAGLAGVGAYIRRRRMA